MKKSNLELIALGIGIVILIATAFLMFSGALSGADSMFYANIAIAVGFLVYIGYNWLTTNGLNKDIRNLNKHVSSLKAELKKKEEHINSLKQDVHILENEKQGLNTQLLATQEKVVKLTEELEVAQKNQNPPQEEQK